MSETRKLPAWTSHAAIGAALAVLVAWSFWQRWQILAASPFPLGVDGYFYPIQIRSLLESGSLQYPASPLTFWFMAPFAAATDPITGAKLGAALGSALIALPAYAVGARLARSRGAGLLAAAIASTSASSVYLAMEFVKQGIGLTVALTALWLVLRTLDEPTRRRIAIAIGGIVATLLAHKLAAALVIVIAVPALAEEARARGTLRGRRLLYVVAGSVVAAIVVLVLGLVAPQRFLAPGDAALLGSLMSSHARWSAPALVMPRFELAFDHEAVVGLGSALGAAVVLVMSRAGRSSSLPTAVVGKRGHGERVAAWVIVISGIVIGLPWLAVDNPQGLAFRLRVAAFVPLALTAPIVLAALATRLAPRVRDIGFAVLALLLALRMIDRPVEGRVVAHPALVSGVIAATTKIPAGATVIVPERHILFMVAWYTRAPVSLRPELVPYPQRVRLLPLAFTGMGSPLEHALDEARLQPDLDPPIGLHPRHHNGLVLVTERTWDWLMKDLGPSAKPWIDWPTI
ncbi:MAG: hypothetical protein HOV81_25875 [Kofleriaceae bacterium]|nr:hypothetical protein [Kofleriaceae bacterium]